MAEAIQIRKAEKKRRKLRLALVGISKSGKTLTGLKFARALAGPEGQIGVIDSEGGNSEIYQGEEGVGDFLIVTPSTFSPETYIDAMVALVRAGCVVVMMDSISHAWMGRGGVLEIVDEAPGQSKFTSGWAKATPMHNSLIGAINSCPAHVIATMRQKADYVLETDSKGKQVPKKVGMAAVQREGMEYEFDIVGLMNDGNMTVDGIRGTALEPILRKTFKHPGAEFIERIRGTLDESAPVLPPPAPEPRVTPPPAAAPSTNPRVLLFKVLRDWTGIADNHDLGAAAKSVFARLGFPADSSDYAGMLAEVSNLAAKQTFDEFMRPKPKPPATPPPKATPPVHVDPVTGEAQPTLPPPVAGQKPKMRFWKLITHWTGLKDIREITKAAGAATARAGLSDKDGDAEFARTNDLLERLILRGVSFEQWRDSPDDAIAMILDDGDAPPPASEPAPPPAEDPDDRAEARPPMPDDDDIPF